MLCDANVFRIKEEDTFKNSKKLEDTFHYRNLAENHELYANEDKIVNDIFNIETAEGFKDVELGGIKTGMYFYMV